MTPGPEAEAIRLFEAGRFAEAETAFRAILEKNPRHANAQHALGVIALQAGRLDESIDWLHGALRAEPGSFAILYNLATALRRAGRAAEAIPAFRRAVAINARSAEAHLGLGNALRDVGDRRGARESFNAALRIDPGHAGAQYNLALVALDEGDIAAAEAGLRRAVEREPANADAWNHLGLLAQRAERYDEALSLFDRALAARPAFAPAMANRGNVLKDRGDLDGALAEYERAIAADPAETGAWVNKASIALERGDLPGAHAAASRALAIRPILADAQYALGLAQLAGHAFESGWDGYERRFETEPPVAAVAAPHAPRLAAGEIEKVKRIALRREQGLGDQILFSTLIPELVGRGIEVVLEVDPRLSPAYRRSLPRITVANGPEDLAACERELPLGSLPSLFRRTRGSFAHQPQRLLIADPERVETIRAGLPAPRCVAIAWRSFQGAGRRHIGEKKSIPLERFAAFESAGMRLLDVQYGDVADERRAFDERHPGLRAEVPGLDRHGDIEGVLAAIEACDLVITSSNVTAHFAGALGKRTWLVYLGASPPFHYWAPREDGRALWYPSVEIVTDRAWTTWETAFEAIAMRLPGALGG